MKVYSHSSVWASYDVISILWHHLNASETNALFMNVELQYLAF